MEEAIAEATRIAGLGLIPPRFIVRATLAPPTSHSNGSG